MIDRPDSLESLVAILVEASAEELAKAVELLRRSIPAPAQYEAMGFAELCGGWPLLATVVGSHIRHDVSAGAPLGRAVQEAGEALSGHGPQAFDVWDADQRRRPSATR